jgi:hypothetical protein
MSTPAEHRESLVKSFVEIALNNPGDFLKVKETLTRIGIASKRTNTLYQSCHILHKKGKYYIVHFKELLQMDGLTTDLSSEDKDRRNQIAHMLHEWKLLTVVDTQKHPKPENFFNVRVISYHDKDKWSLVPKYSIGKGGKKHDSESEIE